MHYGWSSVSLPQLLQRDSNNSITDDDGSWIAVLLLLGAVCGSLLAGITMDKFGRKKVILFTSVPFIISWIMLAYVRSVPLLLLGRFIAGISDGLIFCAIPMYLGEISDPKIRGFTGSYVSVSMIFGMLLVNIIGSYVSITTTALISSSVPILLLLTFSWMPESPYYLIMKENLEEAKQSLMLFKGTDDVEEELNRLVKAVEEQNSNTGRYLDLFTVKSNRRAMYVIMGTRGAQQCGGPTAIVFYAQTLFEEAGNVISPSVASIIYFTTQVIFAGLASVIVDKTGRRPLMIISIIGMALVLLIESCYFWIRNTTDIDTSPFALISVVALIIFVVVYSIGMLTVPLLLIGEVFPTNVKSFAVSFSDIYFCVVTTIVSKFFQFTKDKYGLHVPFTVFTACSVLGLLFIIFYVPETKGRTLEEIQEDLKGERKITKSRSGQLKNDSKKFKVIKLQTIQTIQDNTSL